VIDISAEGPSGELANDTGTSDSDGVTTDGTVNVSGLEDGAAWQYSVDGGTTWEDGSGNQFELAPGSYDDVLVRQTDVAGNTSANTSLGAITVAVLAAVDDTAGLDMGAQSSITYPSQTATDVTVAGLLESEYGTDNSVTVTIADDATGEVRIEVSQTALVAVADAFRLDVVDADGNVVYSAVTDNSLLGDVAGLGVLGLTDNDTLVATVTGLAPGDYSVVVRNDESTLGGLLDTDGDGVSLQELGDAGVVLGPDNQALILDTVSDAVGGGLLGDTVAGTLGLLLGGLNGSPVSDLVGALSGVLGDLGLSALVDGVVGALAEALLSNTLTLLQSTSITTEVTEFDFANETVSGNVIDGDGAAGADDVAAGAAVSLIAHANGASEAVPASGTVQIAGDHGVLEIAADGTYTYTSFGDAASIGQSDTFTYTLSDGTSSDTAALTIEIDGVTVSVGDDAATAQIEWANVTDPDYVDTSGTLVGLLFGEGSYTSDPIIIDPNMDVSGEVGIFVTTALLSSGTLYIEQQVGTGWDVVAEQGFTIPLNLVDPNVASIDLADLGLGAGTYRVRATLGGAASIVNVNTDVDVVYTDEYVVADSSDATGNLLNNDEPGSGLTVLSIFDASTGDYVDVSPGVSVTIQGDFGSLEVSSDGSYTYAVDTSLDHYDTIQTDSFEYRLTHPNQQSAEGSLEISVEPSGAGVADPEPLFMAMLESPDASIDLGDGAADAPQPDNDGGDVGATEGMADPAFTDIDPFHMDPIVTIDGIGRNEEQPI